MSERSRESCDSGDSGGGDAWGGVRNINPGTHGCEVRHREYNGLAKEVDWLRERLVVLENENIKRDKDEVVRDNALRSTFKAVKSDVKKLRQCPQGGLLGTRVSPTLSPTEYQKLLNQLMQSIGLGNYVTHDNLAMEGFVDKDQLKRPIPSIPTIPVHLGRRLDDLEQEVLKPAGTLRVLDNRVRDPEDRKVGNAVIIQGYVSRDLAGVKA